MSVISNLSLANTFGQWVNKTNDLVDTINTLYENNFIKPSGTLTLNESGTSLSVAGSALFQKTLEVGGTGSSLLVHTNAEIQGTLLLSNTGANALVISSPTGSANIGNVAITGPNHALSVSNNAVIFGILDTNILNSNILTVTTLKNNYVNSAFYQANTAASFANGAFARANSGYDQANSVYAFANTGYTQANNAASFANGAFARANSVYDFANTGYSQANSAASFANGAFSRANSGYGQANSASSFANGAFVMANSSYDQANSAASFANGAFTQANSEPKGTSAASFANGAFSRANSGYGQANSASSFANGAFVTANSAASFANGAFTKANTSLQTSGNQTLTGDFAVTGNLSASGAFTINGATVYNTDTFTLNAAAGSNQNGTFASYRPIATGGVTANASLRWVESVQSWRIRDILNSDVATAYANVVTSNLTSSTTQAGIVQLTDSTSSTSTTTAATPNSVKTAFDRVVSAYAFANTGYTQANNAASFANGAFVTANSGASFANGAFVTANSAASFANGSFVTANSGASFANGAFVTANSAASFANGAFVTANSAASFANGAFTAANGKFSSSGGTISGSVTITGDLTINGTTTTVNTQNIDVTDSLIKLAKNNTSGDTLDIGFFGAYQNLGATRFTGLVRKASDKFYLIQGATVDPTANTIDWSNFPTVPQRASLNANFTGGTVSGLASAIAVADGGTGTTTSTGTGSVVLHTGPELVSPIISGTPTSPLAAVGTSNTMIATTSFVQTANTNLRLYTDTQINANLASSKLYTDGNINSNVASVKLYTDGNINSNVASVKLYTDSNINANVASVKLYTDSNINANVAKLLITANTGDLIANGVNTPVVLGSGSILLGLSTTTVAAGTYANANTISVVTFDSKGRATYAANVPIQITTSQITGYSPGSSIVDDTSTDSTRYPLFATATTGTLSTAYTSSSNYTYNPLTGTLSVTNINSQSDSTLKGNVEPVTYAIDTVQKLNGVSFNWLGTGAKSFGVIAQDVEKVIPEVVSTDSNGIKSVNYQALSAFLIESIKELKAEIETLKQQIK